MRLARWIWIVTGVGAAGGHMGCTPAPEQESTAEALQAWVTCGAGNQCYVAQGDRATLGPDGNPANAIIGCASESDSLPGLDLIGCFVCDNSVWATCAPGLVPCGTTNECYLTSSGKATLGPDGDPTHDPAGCVSSGGNYLGLDDLGCFTCVDQAWATCPVGKSTSSENFEVTPVWSSMHDAPWGSAAEWLIGDSGQSGNYLRAVRNGPGSSVSARVYDVTPNSDYQISIYMRGASSSADYWVESGYRLGAHTAFDFDSNAGAWKIVKKFSKSGTNGNGNVWTKYTKSFNSGNNSKITVGFKTGNTGGAAPTARWDTLRIK